jgi:signal transduction histidine kinase
MTEAIMANLFEEIKSSSKGTNNEYGTGLGLILVKDFVSQHGGTLSVDSKEKEGTCFKFSIPVHVLEINKVLK